MLNAALVSFGLLLSSGAAAPAEPMKCEVGPVLREFGGSQWIVYSCSDGKSLVFITANDNPAGPFFFMSFPKDGAYALYGEGNGSKEASQAAHNELSRMTSTERQTLLDETKAVTATPKP